MPPQFYNLRDQAIYSAGDFFIPQQKYRAAPYNVNNPAPDDPAAAGIPAIYQSQGGGGGGTYTGGISDLTGDFFKTISDRQNRLTELNRPMREIPGEIIPGVRGDEIIMERLAPYGAPADFYEGSIEGIPQTIKGASGIFTRGEPTMEKPTLNRRIQDTFYSLPFLSKPQSADQIIAEGYTGRSNMPGIMSMVLGSMDKYGELPRGDQAFIARNMGYTGPTVFGENTTGGAKDPFGLNVRSAFGNYAERVGKEVDKLGFALSDEGKTGKKYDATFNPATGLFEGPEADKANRMTKMMRAKLNFYQKQVVQRDADRAAAKAAEEKAIQQRIDNERAAGAAANQAMQRQEGGGGGGNLTRSREQGGLGLSASQAQAVSAANAAAGMGGYGLKEGGIVDMLEIYD